MYRHLCQYSDTLTVDRTTITVDLQYAFSSDAEKSEKEKIYLHKLNMILVQILKQEWPKNWPTFISGEFFSLISI